MTDVCEWRKTTSCQQLLDQKASFGGYEDYSYLPDSLEALKQLHIDKSVEVTRLGVHYYMCVCSTYLANIHVIWCFLYETLFKYTIYTFV